MKMMINGIIEVSTLNQMLFSSIGLTVTSAPVDSSRSTVFVSKKTVGLEAFLICHRGFIRTLDKVGIPVKLRCDRFHILLRYNLAEFRI